MDWKRCLRRFRDMWRVLMSALFAEDGRCRNRKQQRTHSEHRSTASASFCYVHEMDYIKSVKLSEHNSASIAL